MDILQETYTALWNLELVDNHCHFSEAWLNKSPRYYSVLRAKGTKPSVDALARLATNLKQRHDLYQNSRHDFLHERANRLGSLATRVFAEVQARALENQSVTERSKRRYRTDPDTVRMRTV